MQGESAVMYAGKVWKWNKYFMKQERILIVTNLYVYNFDKKSNQQVVVFIELKRFFAISQLAGLTKSLSEKNLFEFVIHVKSEYDYRLECKE